MKPTIFFISFQLPRSLFHDQSVHKSTFIDLIKLIMNRTEKDENNENSFECFFADWFQPYVLQFHFNSISSRKCQFDNWKIQSIPLLCSCCMLLFNIYFMDAGTFLGVKEGCRFVIVELFCELGIGVPRGGVQSFQTIFSKRFYQLFSNWFDS